MVDFKPIAEIPSFVEDKITNFNETKDIINEQINSGEEDVFENEQPLLNDMIGDLSATGEFDEFCDYLEEIKIDLSRYYQDDEYSITFLKELEESANSDNNETLTTFEVTDSLYKILQNKDELDKNALIDILSDNLSSEQLLEISRYYKGKYGSDLVEVLYDSGDTSFSELLSAKIQSAKDFEGVNAYETSAYSIQNKNNIQYGESITTISETENGNITTCSSQNEAGEVINEEVVEKDKDGNIISRTVSQHIYDENGKPRQEIVIEYGPDGKERKRYSSSLDENGNLTQEYLKVTYSDGTSEEKSTEYAYDDPKDTNLCTQMQETNVYYDAKGNETYVNRKETQDTLIGYLKQIGYNRTSGEYLLGQISTAKSVEELLQIYKTNGLNIDYEKSKKDWENSFLNADLKVAQMSSALWESTYKELKAKVDMFAYDKSFGIGAFFNEAEKNRMLNELNEAHKNKDYKKLEKVYNKIHEKLYPKASHNPLSSELFEMVRAKEQHSKLSSSEISKNMKIRSNYDPKTMEPQTQGEMLLYQLQEVKDQFELAKSNSGTLDTMFSLFNNIFDAGTSEDDFNAIVEKYEEQLRKLSSLKGDEFLASFKALTGEDFSEQTLNSINTAQISCNLVDGMKDEKEIEDLAKSLKVNIQNAWKSSEKFKTIQNPDGTITSVPNEDYGVVDYDKLKTLVKQNLLEATSFGASKSTPKKGFEDYEETVSEQRDFIIDLIKMSATTIAASTGILGALGCGLVSMTTQMLAEFMNSDAIGDKKVTPKELASSMASSFIGGFFQEGQVKTLLGDVVSKNFNVKPGTLFDLIYKAGNKGVTDGLKFSIEFLLDIENKTQEEKDMFFKDLLIESGKGVVEGAVIAICLLGADKVSDFITSETRKYLLSKTSEILKAGAHNGIDTIEEVVAQIIQTSINSGTKKTVEAMLAQDFEAEELMGSTWKDIRKKLFKSGLTSIRGKV